MIASEHSNIKAQNRVIIGSGLVNKTINKSKAVNDYEGSCASFFCKSAKGNGALFWFHYMGFSSKEYYTNQRRVCHYGCQDEYILYKNNNNINNWLIRWGMRFLVHKLDFLNLTYESSTQLPKCAAYRDGKKNRIEGYP